MNVRHLIDSVCLTIKKKKKKALILNREVTERKNVSSNELSDSGFPQCTLVLSLVDKYGYM